MTENSETIKHNAILLHRNKIKYRAKKETNKVKIPTTTWEIHKAVLFFIFILENYICKRIVMCFS